MLQLALLAAFSTCMWFYQTSNSGPIVSTESGYVKGDKRKTWNNRIFIGFTGIPYAKPPTGNLRFKPPVPIDPWSDVYDATQSHNVCPQSGLSPKNIAPLGNEDCLYLNIYTPKVRAFEPILYPVLIYIHGGSFSIGSAREDWIGPELLLDRDVVLVTINYRLGALGFLSFQDPIISGNNGLKDQALAIKWTFRNIHNFGGDPNKITLFGNSAGSIASHLHAMSPLSKHLINSIILQSGNGLFLPIRSSLYDPLTYAHALADCVRCPHNSSKKFLECMSKIHAYRIIRCNSNLSNMTKLPFRPIVENTRKGAFLSEHPYYLIKRRIAGDIPVMTGVVGDEGGFGAAEITSNPGLLNDLNEHFNSIVCLNFNLKVNENACSWIRKFYFNNSPIDESNQVQLAKMIGDGFFISVNEEYIRAHFQYLTSPIYQYFFNYRGTESYGKLFTPNYTLGVTHTDELFYLLPRKNLFPKYIPSEDDKKVSEVLTKLWVNFANTGNPTPNSDPTISTIWRPVKTENCEYLEILSHNEFVMKDKLFFDRTAVWRKWLQLE